MVAWFATKGSESNDAMRMEMLLEDVPNRVEWPFDKRRKLPSFRLLMQRIRAERPALLVMEGTGIAGGIACLLGRILWGVPYLVSSGDAVGPFVRTQRPLLGLPFEVYERLLCRLSSGFIGWTPYLCGRALTFGAPRAVTAPGWVLHAGDPGAPTRETTRERWGIHQDHLVIGIVGSLEWNGHRSYSYGWDLVQAVPRLKRTDVSLLIVGEGSGLARLRAAAGSLLGVRIFLPGAVPASEVLPAMAAMDVASLPQSMDGVGMFRYTTKLCEYALARLPVITNQIPVAYDLGCDWMWRVPGANPWAHQYLDGLVDLLDRLTPGEIARHREAIPKELPEFDYQPQRRRVTAFVRDILEQSPA